MHLNKQMKDELAVWREGKGKNEVSEIKPEPCTTCDDRVL